MENTDPKPPKIPETLQNNDLTESLNLKNLVTDPTKLKTHDTHVKPTMSIIKNHAKLHDGIVTPQMLKWIVNNNYGRYYGDLNRLTKIYDKKGIDGILENPNLIILYVTLIQTRLPIGEPVIANAGFKYIMRYVNAKAGYIHNYFHVPLFEPIIAQSSIKAIMKYVGLTAKPFPLAEPRIAKSGVYSYEYADMTKRRFKLGEPAIAKNTEHSYWYAKHVLKGPFPLGEPAIAKVPVKSFNYAYHITKKPFPLGEPAIAKDGWYSYLYAKDVLKKPFPLGEPVIYDSRYRKDYEKDVLKGRSWTGLKKKKVKEAIDLKKLVSDPTKLKTVDTHISPEEAYDRLKKGEKDEYLIHAIAKDAQYSHVYAEYVLKNPFPLGEPAIAKNADSSYRYARHVLKKPFPLGEPAIAKDAEYSYRYAQDVLEKPFPLGEPAISKSAAYSRAYALYVLKKPFPLGEPTIAKDAMDSYWYAKKVLKNPFPLGEPAIAKDAQYSGMYEHYVLKGRPWTGLKKKKVKEAIDLKNLVSDPKKLKTHDTHISAEEAYRRLSKGETDEYLLRAVAKDAQYSYTYAKYVSKRPFPLGEPAMAKNAEWSYLYAGLVLKNPFPLGEPAIAKEAFYAYRYAKYVLKNPFPLGEPAIYRSELRKNYKNDVLKGRPWTGLDQKVKEAMDLKKLVDDPKKLKTHDTHISPDEALKRLQQGETDEYLLKVVIKDPITAFAYVERVLKKPFPLGEPIIASRPYTAYHYATEILKGPFPLGEPVIAKDGWYSYLYAQDVLEKPFPLGEPAIAKNAKDSYHYARDVLKKPFPLGEPAIVTDALLSYLYAKDVLKKPFPLGEPTIAKDAEFSYHYATEILKGPFPLGEPAIAEDSWYAYAYTRDILKGRPWTGLNKKIDEALNLKDLVSDPSKLKTHETHVSPTEALKLLKAGQKDNFLISAVAKSSRTALLYAKWINKRFELGEPMIAKDGVTAYLYARKVLKSPFPEGENAIYNSDMNVMDSHPTVDVFLPVRDAYERFVLKGRPWTGLKKKKVKEAINLKKLVSDPKKLKTHDTHISPEEAYERLKNGETDEYLIRGVAKDAEYSYIYARYVLEKPFPLGEPAIAKDAYCSYLYAKDILEKPWPLGEPAIAKDRWYAYAYTRDILKGRPWTGLDQKVDESMDLKNLVSDPKKLKTHDTHISPEEALSRLQQGQKDAYLFNAVSKNADTAYYYAKNYIGDRFPLGEPAIAKDSEYALLYATNVVKEPWPEGEPAIAKNASTAYDYSRFIDKRFEIAEPELAKIPSYAFAYAKYVLKGRFEQGEPAIAKNTDLAYEYARDVLQKPFPLGEPAIAKKASLSYNYAEHILKGPFPLGEPTIAVRPIVAIIYAKNVLKGPFPLGEPGIYDSYLKDDYEKDVLKGKPWTGLNQQVTEALNLKKLVSDPTKLQTYNTHAPLNLGIIKKYAKLHDGIVTPAMLEWLYGKSLGYPTGKKIVEVYREKGINGILENPKYISAYIELLPDGVRLPIAEPIIAKLNVSKILDYVIDTKMKSFPLAEPVIAKYSDHALHYAQIIRKRFPLGEPAIAKSPYDSYEYAKYVLKGPFPLGEPAIKNSAGAAASYAAEVLKKRWPEGERAIAKSAYNSRLYAEDALRKRRFLRGEPAIAKNAEQAYYYAYYVLKGPFPLAEPAIYEDNWYRYNYKKYILKNKPWTGLKKKKVKESIDLKKLVSDPEKLKTHKTHISPLEAYERLENGETDEYLVHAVAKDAETAYDYADYVLKKPFPLGEPAIAKDALYSYWYASSVLDGPFPLGEPAIATDAWHSYLYARYILNSPFSLGEPAIYNDNYWRHVYQQDILKGQPWTGLKKKKVDEAIDLKNLVSDPKKLKTVDTHISPEDAYYKLRNYAYRYGTKRKNKYIHLLGAVLKSAEYSYLYAENVLNGPFPEGEPVIAKDPELSLNYARNILHGSFPLGEPVLAKSTEGSYIYAKDVLEGPFPLGEPAIAKDAYLALMYAKHVLRGPFPKGEREIAKYPNLSMIYVEDVLKGKPWTGLKKKKVKEAIDLKKLVSEPKKLKTRDTHLGPKDIIKKMKRSSNPFQYTEILSKFHDYKWAKYIKKNPKYAYKFAKLIDKRVPNLEKVIAKDPAESVNYASLIIKGRFELAEREISKDYLSSYLYAKNALKGPFPLGEPAIYNSILRKSYHQTILDHYNRSWTGLDQKVKEAIDLKKLVSEPKKLKTHDTHIGPWEAIERIEKGDTDPILETAIATDARASYDYAKNVLEKPFPLGEPAIATNAVWALQYARYVLDGPFPLAEPEIAKSPIRSYEYAEYVLEGRFVLGEPMIATVPDYSLYYAMYVLEGRFRLGEPAIFSHPELKKIYLDKFKIEQ